MPAHGARRAALRADMLPAAGSVVPRDMPARLPGWLLAPAAPIVRSAAAAGGGFLAGIALMGLVHRRRRRASLPAARRRRRAPDRRPGSGRGAELVQIVGSRSLLVDLHLLGER